MSQKSFPEIIAEREAHQPFQENPSDELVKLWQINRQLARLSQVFKLPHSLAIVKIMQCTVCGIKGEVRKAASYYYVDRSEATPEGWYSPSVCGACKEEYCAASLKLQKAETDTRSLLDKVYQAVKVQFLEWLNLNGYNRRIPPFVEFKGKRQLVLRLSCDCGKTHDFVSDDMARTPIPSDGWVSTSYGTECPDCFARTSQDNKELNTLYKQGGKARREKLAELYTSTPPAEVHPETIEVPEISHWEGYKFHSERWTRH